AQIGNEKAEDLVRVIRTHPRFRQTGVFVVGQISDTPSLLRAGADDVLAGQAWVLHAERIQARLPRFRNWTWDLVPITGQLNRAGVLRMVDKMTDNARRSKEPLSVAVLAIRGLQETQKQFGPAAGFAGLRKLSTALQMGLRTPDLIGHLNPKAFLVALPNCTIINAEQRMQEIQVDFHRKCQADKRLQLLSCVYGLADTDLGLTGLVQRADSALQKNKGTA
ncbi:MAG: GGDEF domain-containing protein, partial [Proteobacteria bacterium]|nr:GGDEF domain-containing protein [Pseudomonadota bacterium]